MRTYAIDPDVARCRGRLGPAVRDGNTEEADRARRDLRAALLAKHIREAVAATPPLTDEQRARLAGLLLTPGAES